MQKVAKRQLSIWTITVFALLAVLLPSQPSSNITRGIHPGDAVLSQIRTWLEQDSFEHAFKMALDAVPLFEKEQVWTDWGEAYELAYRCARKSGSLALQKQLQPMLQRAAVQVDSTEGIPQMVQMGIWAKKGFLSHLLGHYDTALAAYEKGIPLATHERDTATLLRMLGSAAILYWTHGDDYKALEYHQIALHLAEAQTDTTMVAAISSNIGNVYRGLGDPQCITYYLRSLSLRPDNPEAALLLSKAYLEVAPNHSAAFTWANKALRYATYPDERADALHQMGRVYAAQTKHAQALRYYRRSLALAYEGYGQGHPEAEKIHVFMARSLSATGQHEAALVACNRTLQALLPQFVPSNQHDNPLPSAFTAYNLWILEALIAKSEIYQAQFAQSQQHQFLKSALSCAETGLVYLQAVRLRYGEESSKHEINDYIRPTCETALRAAFALYRQTTDITYLKRAFSIAENIKATALSEALHSKYIKKIAGVPQEMIQKERYLNGRIAYWAKAMQPSDSNTVAKDSLFWLKRRMDSLENVIQTAYPNYAAALYAYKGETHADSTAVTLPPDAALITYFMGKQTQYTFLVTPTSFWAEERALPKDFEVRLAQFRKTTSDWASVNQTSNSCDRIFLKEGYQLYQLLLQRPLQQTQAHRLFIVPDGVLHRLPFETLPVSAYTGSWIDREVPLLLKERAVSYRFSARALPAMSQRAGGWGGWGLDYSDISFSENAHGLRGFGKLPHASSEIKSVAHILDGFFWLNQAATREHFLQNAHKFGVLHLAMHGWIDEQDPLRSRLLFSQSLAGGDPFVYASDLYGLQLNAGLAVLSSCNSGSGRVESGEGIMSLSRAFAYAGCPSMVMSLWSVSDQSTEHLMVEFYRFLSAGKTKDEALRLAKLNYLTTSSSEYAKPIYWSGFVPIGNMEAFPSSVLHRPWYKAWPYIAFSLMTLLLLSMWGVRRFKHRKAQI